MIDQQTFNQACEISFNEEHWQKINYNTSCFETSFEKGKENYRNMDLEKQRAYILRNKSVMNLEKLLVDFETHFNENGGKVLWARNTEDAQDLIYEIIQKTGIKTISRSHSNVLDEIEINDFLKSKNIDLLETSVARFILQSAEMRPYHPLSPMIHLSKEEINEVLTKTFKLKEGSSTKQMVNFIRYKSSMDMKNAGICLTGANFLLSDEGGVVLTENEGNILKASSKAKIHIVVAGIGKVIPNIDDLSILLPLLSSHATGQSMAAYNTITFGPSKNKKGPEQMYVILLNNDRSEILVHEKQRKIMSCIHCGACVNVCPIYNNIGGYTYQTPHVGPLGVIMTPLMKGMKEYNYLVTLCALCGKCTDSCPVKIPLDDLMIENRNLKATEQTGSAKIDLLFKTMIWHCRSRKRLDSPIFFKKMELKRLLGNNWGKRTCMPEIAPKSFSQMWKETHNEN